MVAKPPDRTGIHDTITTVGGWISGLDFLNITNLISSLKLAIHGSDLVMYTSSVGGPPWMRREEEDR